MLSQLSGMECRIADKYWLITGSIARSAMLPVISQYLSANTYSEADFKVFRPAGATRCTDASYPKFSAPPSGETPNVLEVKERARGPLSPCQVCWGSNVTRRRGGQKR